MLSVCSKIYNSSMHPNMHKYTEQTEPEAKIPFPNAMSEFHKEAKEGKYNITEKLMNDYKCFT